MLNIFVSRPTVVGSSFERGLEGFLEILDKMELAPRTLGGTDQPTTSPLDEVIRLLDACAGAVILGYPQLRVDKGVLKGAPLSEPLVLPTEWNHIEAGLAYARDLPLLLVGHSGVQRGIFDRGAIPGFLHVVDMSTDTWALQEPIAGALKSWKSRVLEPRREVTTSATNRGGSGSPDTHLRDPLPEELVGALKQLATADDGSMTASELALALEVPQQKAQYFLDGLAARKLVRMTYYVNRAPGYLLDARGRAALVELGLL